MNEHDSNDPCLRHFCLFSFRRSHSSSRNISAEPSGDTSLVLNGSIDVSVSLSLLDVMNFLDGGEMCGPKRILSNVLRCSSRTRVHPGTFFFSHKFCPDVRGQSRTMVIDTPRTPISCSLVFRLRQSNKSHLRTIETKPRIWRGSEQHGSHGH